ncbi:putative ABC transport system substrate-binding protein [Bradyrhizobium sp. LB7.2]
MRRREFITPFGGTAATWPLAARAQQPARRVYRVGYLSISFRERTIRYTEAFEQGLRSLGYHVGENVIIEYRFANGDMGRLSGFAAELVGLGLDIIMATGGNPSVVAAMKATTAIPIVMTSAIDPVATGLVASLARPGGNVTGVVADAGGEILGKRFELLKEALPDLSRLGILFNPDVVATRNRQTAIRGAAEALGLTIIPTEASGPDAFEQAFALMVRKRAQAFVMQGDTVLFNYRDQIADMAIENRLPAASLQREYAEAGFFLTYGASSEDYYRRSAAFVDRIFHGAKPADLPVEQPTKFELVINIKTAKALGLTVPPSLLVRADEVIE